MRQDMIGKSLKEQDPILAETLPVQQEMRSTGESAEEVQPNIDGIPPTHRPQSISKWTSDFSHDKCRIGNFKLAEELGLAASP